MLTIAEYNNEEQLRPLRSVWNRLLDKTLDPKPSQKFDWLQTEPVSDNETPRVMVGTLNGEVFGILPLRVEVRETPRGPMRFLTSRGGKFAGPVGPHTAAMLTAGFRHIHNSPRDWDLLSLEIDATSPLVDRLENTFRLMGWRFEREVVSHPSPISEYHAPVESIQYTHLHPLAVKARWWKLRERMAKAWDRFWFPHTHGQTPSGGVEPTVLKLYDPGANTLSSRRAVP